MPRADAKSARGWAMRATATSAWHARRAELGRSANAGSKVYDRQFKFRIALGPLTLAEYLGAAARPEGLAGTARLGAPPGRPRPAVRRAARPAPADLPEPGLDWASPACAWA
jgi:hypothetical protein